MEFEGRTNGNQLVATITNRGAGTLVSASGTAETKRIAVDNRGGSAKLQAEGKVVLFR